MGALMKGKVMRFLSQRKSGAVAVEAAILLPIFLVILIGFLDAGRLFYAQLTVKNASVEIARSMSFGNGPENPSVLSDLRDNMTQGALRLAGGSPIATSTLTYCPQGVEIDGTNVAIAILEFEFQWYSPLGLLAGGQNLSGNVSTYRVTSQAVCQA